MASQIPIRVRISTLVASLPFVSLHATRYHRAVCLSRSDQIGVQSDGFEYEAGPDGYITWINDGEKSWTLRSGALAADPRVGIARRPVPEEPMVRVILSHFQPEDMKRLMRDACLISI